MKQNEFKIIIVGGGPIGLMAAHLLHLADIDFLLLERRPQIVEDQGASLIIWPHTLRVFYQLGILERVLSVSQELYQHLSFTKEGYAFGAGHRWQRVLENHGHRPIACHRADIVDILYNTLPPTAKAKVLTGKKLTDIQNIEGGVRVTCEDGSSFQATAMIGADGVHSKTRSLMRRLALEEDPARDWDPEAPYLSTYRLLFGSFEAVAQPGLGYYTHSQDKSTAFFSGEKRGWFFLYEKLPKPTRDVPRYTEKDMQKLAAEFSDFHLTESVTVKDAWSKMLGYGMTNLQEGIVKNWSLGRIVLAGDACHKFTTHLGLGFNNGVQDVVVLCNALQKVRLQHMNSTPDVSVLSTAFQEYEELRKDPSRSSLQPDLANSGFEMRMHSWNNLFYWIISRFLTPPDFVEQRIIDWVLSPELQKAAVLDYVNKPEPMTGRVKWEHTMEV